MQNKLSLPWLLGCAALTALGAPLAAQGPFIDNTTDIPGGAFNGGYTESVTFGDVDNDGDWDVAFANGGDIGNQQNRIWINLGPAQLGVFQDQTAQRFPAVLDASRDLQFVDFDGDGWLDIHVSNHSSFSSQSNRWWHNTGGGFWVDETHLRWVGLGQPGSSITPFLVLASGGFIDFCSSSRFGDLDNDGDLDLVHSSYGGGFSGQVPTRIFLNDGAGFFSEFNPSGYQLTGSNIQNGDPGLWCEGTQQADTLDSTGQRCDIATTAVDIDLGDIDGDFDLDILHGARGEPPRMFQNRLEENSGVLSFRDVTGAVFPAGYVTGNGHYAQEFGDMDGDGDLDIYGLNWHAGGFFFNDITLRNDGTGVYDAIYLVPASGADFEQVTFFDYDNDGDLDVFIANWSGKDKLYRNDGGVTDALVDETALILTTQNLISKDARACDVDGDGDYDVFVANSQGARNRYMQNAGGVPDTHAPYIPSVEQAPDRVAGPAPTVLRAHVYDNAPHYITAFNPTAVLYTVDGGPVQTSTATCSGQQVFRAELPGELVGTICYRWASRDEYGNPGFSSDRCYQAAEPGTTGTPFCFGDGGGTPCPCGNTGAAGHGCASATFATGSMLSASGTASVSADSLVLQAISATPSAAGLFFQGDEQVGGGLGVHFGDGLRCAGVSVVRLEVLLSSAQGEALSSVPLASTGGVGPGQLLRYQYWYRDPGTSPCGTLFNLSNGLEITWAP